MAICPYFAHLLLAAFLGRWADGHFRNPGKDTQVEEWEYGKFCAGKFMDCQVKNEGSLNNI